MINNIECFGKVKKKPVVCKRLFKFFNMRSWRSSKAWSQDELFLNKLESIQNRAARLVFSTGRRSHAMPLLTELHWLPLPYRIDFKICLTVFKIVNNCAPQYLINMLTRYKPVRNLRSSHDKTQLVVPGFNLSLSGQCFSIYAPKVWNELPSSIREAPSVAAFKNQLKTHFFCKL